VFYQIVFFEESDHGLQIVLSDVSLTKNLNINILLTMPVKMTSFVIIKHKDERFDSQVQNQ